MRKAITEALRERILVLDGAMGTMIQRLSPDEQMFRGTRFIDHPVPLKGLNDMLDITAPDIIADIHRQYIEAGADIIETNTFNANAISLREYGLESMAEELNLAGARLARSVAGEGRYVAGSMGPTGVSLSIPAGHSVTFDELAGSYRTQASALIRGGVDLLLIETVFDTLNAKAAIYGIGKAFADTGIHLPIMISATLTQGGRLLSGQSLEGFIASVSHARPLSVGLNCGFGAAEMSRFIPVLDKTPYYTSVHPNAGLPDETGRYTETPSDMVRHLAPMIDKGMLNIVGGCCGTTPEHISEIAKAVRGKAPRVPAHEDDDRLRLSGLDCFTPEGFIKVGERCNVAGSKKFLRLVSENKFNEATDIAAAQIEAGASVIDINMDDAMLEAAHCMEEFIGRLNSDGRTCGVPYMIDSSDMEVIIRALKLIPGRPVVNSISLKEGEKRFVSNASEIKALGGTVVVMAFDEKGQATTLERRIEICRRAYEILTEKVGFRPGDIIFDPNVLTVGTGIEAHDNYAVDFLDSVAWIHSNLPGTKVSGGISNLSFAFRGHNKLREQIHTVFLDHAISLGLDMAIVNPSTPLDPEGIAPELCEAIDDLLFNRRNDAALRLLELSGATEGEPVEKSGQKGKSPAGGAPKFLSLSEMMMRGSTDNIEKAVESELEIRGGSAMSVVNESLIGTMNRIGELFGAGKMFLPQVVRSATVMNRAVSLLTPLIEKESSHADGKSSGKKFVIATVKGDVHDIGKNIVAIVLRCSGFEVIDLGVMVPKEEIVGRAVKEGAGFIGLSGLISPSLHEMGEVASLMEKSGLKIPLFVGGAATSDLHTAVRLAPLYSGPVIHTSDAATLPRVAVSLSAPATYDAAVAGNSELQERLRERYEEKKTMVSLEKARSLADKVDQPVSEPLKKGTYIFYPTVRELLPLINWRAFLGEWKLNPGEQGEEGERLVEEARKRLGTSLDERGATAKAMILKAHRTTDDCILLEDGVAIPVLRRQSPNPVSGLCPALSDYIAESDDYIGLFAVCVDTAGGNSVGKTSPADYDALLDQTVSHRLAEAATEWLHRKVCTELWGFPDKCGIRPAVGYPSLPDQSIIFELDRCLRFGEIGITLTENGAMSPGSSTCGLILPSRSARYFSIGPIDEEQRKEYAGRRGGRVDVDRYLIALG